MHGRELVRQDFSYGTRPHAIDLAAGPCRCGKTGQLGQSRRKIGFPYAFFPPIGAGGSGGILHGFFHTQGGRDQGKNREKIRFSLLSLSFGLMPFFGVPHKKKIPRISTEIEKNRLVAPRKRTPKRIGCFIRKLNFETASSAGTVQPSQSGPSTVALLLAGRK